jgi:hypothetical protein
MQSAILNALILLGILVRLAVIRRCVAIGQLQKYRLFCVMLAYAISGSALLFLAATHRVAQTSYTAFWSNTRWLEAILSACAAVEAFWGVARHFRNIRGFGWALIAIIVSISAAAAGTVGILRSEWNGVQRWGLLVGQFVNFALLLTALLSVAFFRQFRKIPVRPNALFHLRALGILFGMSSFGYFLGQITRAEWRFATSLILTVSPTIVYLWWLRAMKPAGEILPFDPPTMSGGEYEAAEAAHRKEADQLKQAGAEALGKTFRSS